MSTNTKSDAASSTSDSKNSDAGFKVVIDDFERCLLRPVISGEMSVWIDDLKQAWSEFAPQIHFRSKHLYARQYREIGEQDPALLPRIDLLKAEDTAIEEQREKINQAITRAAQHVPKLEPDEEKARHHLQNLTDEGTTFVLRVRKQALSVETWYVEAFNRDRGAVD